MRPGGLLLLVYRRFPHPHDLFGEFGDFLCCMRAQFPYSKAGFAFLEGRGKVGTRRSGIGSHATIQTYPKNGLCDLGLLLQHLEDVDDFLYEMRRKSAKIEYKNVWNGTGRGNTPVLLRLVGVISQNV